MLCFPILLLAQQEDDNFLLFEGVINTDESRKASDLFETAKLWFSKPSSDIKRSVDYINSEGGQIQGSFTLPYFCGIGSMKKIKCNGTITFDGTVLLKDGKYRYVFENFLHKGNGISFGKITNESFCPYEEIKHGRGFRNKQWLNIKSIINEKVEELIIDLKNTMGKATQMKDW
ncbi:MAG: DUF4468 domain-containing protein [Bacteroidales bacterium]|nr:DUF4468 domain-containing protein [Bacteroidales bacterium]